MLVIGGASASPRTSEWPTVSRHVSLIARYLETDAVWHTKNQQLLAAQAALLRELHDGVIQDLFGVALTLDGLATVHGDDLRSSAHGVRRALNDLRSVLADATTGSSLNAVGPRPLTTLVDTLTSAAGDVVFEHDLESLTDLPTFAASAVSGFLREGIRNARKHADPTFISASTRVREDLVRARVENDGVRPQNGQPGVGLRLLRYDARRLGGRVSATRREQTWQLTLTLPLARVC